MGTQPNRWKNDQWLLVGGKNLPLDGINTGLLNIFHLYNSLVLSVEGRGLTYSCRILNTGNYK